MKKSIAIISFLLIMIFSVSVGAASVRAVTARPTLTFSGTTAYCVGKCTSQNSSDRISAALTLYQGSAYVKSWSKSGNGTVIISQTATVQKGNSYTLVLSYSVNGQAQPQSSVTATCP